MELFRVLVGSDTGNSYGDYVSCMKLNLDMRRNQQDALQMHAVLIAACKQYWQAVGAPKRRMPCRARGGRTAQCRISSAGAELSNSEQVFFTRRDATQCDAFATRAGACDAPATRPATVAGRDVGPACDIYVYVGDAGRLALRGVLHRSWRRVATRHDARAPRA